MRLQEWKILYTPSPTISTGGEEKIIGGEIQNGETKIAHSMSSSL